MVPFLGLDDFNPVEMNELVGWDDDLHLTIASLIAYPIREGLQKASAEMQSSGLIRQYGDPMAMTLDEVADLVQRLRDAGQVELAGELQKLIFKVQIYDVYRQVDGRDQIFMDYWTDAVLDDTVSPLFLSAQAALDRIDDLTSEEALEDEDIYVANQLEAIDVLASLPRGQVEPALPRWQEERYPMRRVAGRTVGLPPDEEGGGDIGPPVRRLKQRRRSLFPSIPELIQSNTMDDLYDALVAHGSGQLRQIEEVSKLGREFTKPTMNALLVGDRGLGKSSIIASIFGELGLRYAIFNAATMDPYLDLVGLPYVDEVTEEGEIIERVSRTAMPQTLARGVDAIFIDELNRASTPVQNALMQIILEGKVNDQVIPGLKLVWAAINPPQTGSKNYGVQNLNWALQGRFSTYDMPKDVSNRYFLSRGDLKQDLGDNTVREVLDWWRQFQKDPNVGDDEKQFLDPRTLDDLLTKVAGAKRRNEDLLINAIAKSLTNYPTVLDGLGKILGTQASASDMVLDIMEALNQEPNSPDLIMELNNVLTNEPEAARTIFSNTARYLYPTVIEDEIEDINVDELFASEFFPPEDIKQILNKFFQGEGNTFWEIWLRSSEGDKSFQNLTNFFFTILSEYAVPTEDRGPQILANIRNIYRLEALLINAAITHAPITGESGLQSIFTVLDPSIFETEIDIQTLSDINAVIDLLPQMSYQEEFADPVKMAKRDLIWALSQLYLGEKEVLPLPQGSVREAE